MILKNKVAIVTGSTRGIGEAIVRALTLEGVKTIINSNTSINEGKVLENELNSKGFNTIYIQGDISDENDVRGLFDKTIKLYGRIDILVNNAGISYKKSESKKYYFEDYAKMQKINGWGVYLCSKYAAQFMERGKIVNISSIYGIEPNPNSILASGVKAEVESYTKSFAIKCKGKIEVNSVAPGYTNTKIVREKFSRKELKNIVNQTSQKRLLSPKEIADAVVFLLKNDGITGQTIILDGGYLL